MTIRELYCIILTEIGTRLMYSLFKGVKCIPPDIDLEQKVATPELDEESLSKCGKCGKYLESPYYLLLSVSPINRMIGTYKCDDSNREKERIEHFITVAEAACQHFKIEDRYPWIFSKQNIMNSITRLCFGCHKEYKRYLESNHPRYTSRIESDNQFYDDINISEVCFAVQEYQRRRHTPIESTMSDYKKYYMSLPDRSNVSSVYSGIQYEYSGSDDDDTGGYISMEQEAFGKCLEIALRPDYAMTNYSMDHDHVNSISQVLRADFIADENRIIPNDRELTDFMKKEYGVNHYVGDWISTKAVSFCKVFTNPRTKKYANDTNDFILASITQPNLDARNLSIFSKYSVIVHYTDGDWEEVNI